MRADIKTYVLSLVEAYPGTDKALAAAADIDYFVLHRWKKNPDRLIDAVTVQRLYEHLTGKELEY